MGTAMLFDTAIFLLIIAGHRVGDAVSNVLAHSAKLLFACLALSFYCTHFLPFVVNTISSDCGKLEACRLLLVA
jgi:hypothetical protein